MDYRKRMEFLAGELLRHQHLYHVLARPEISDAEYDRLLDELLLLEKRFPPVRQPEFAQPQDRLRPGQRLSREAACRAGAQPGQAVSAGRTRAVADENRGRGRAAWALRSKRKSTALPSSSTMTGENCSTP